MTANPMTRLLAGRSWRILLGLLALIEAIFIAESFTTLMESIVRNGGTVFDLILLLLLKAPEVVDFALPLVLLIGLFFAVTGARDDNELIVCAAAGVPWTRIPAFALKVGLAGFVISVLFAGFVTPLANYTTRLATHALETRRAIEEITRDSPKNSIRRFEGRTFIATPPETPGAKRGNLLVFEPGQAGTWQLSQAEDWTVIGPDEDGSFSIRLKTFREYSGVPSDQPEGTVASDGQLSRSLRAARMTIRQLELDFRLDALIAATDRARRGNEQFLFTWSTLRQAAGGQADRPITDRRLGEVLARALICPFAALMAIAAAAWAGTRSGRLAALPCAAVAVLCGDILARTLMQDAADSGALVFWGILFALMTAVLILPLSYIARCRETIIAPRRGRA